MKETKLFVKQKTFYLLNYDSEMNNDTVLISFPICRFEIIIDIQKYRTDVPKQIAPF